ncbi:MAG: hypothetical protein AB1696_23365 [Planctomycetota bacterium]
MNTNDVRIDEEFRLLSPRLTEEQRRLRVEQITAGYQPTIALWSPHNIVLDGVEDFEICRELGLSVYVDQIDLPDRKAAKEWIIRNELSRPCPAPFHRVELALHFEPGFKAEARQRQVYAGRGAKENLTGPSVNVRKRIAALAEVSEDTVMKVKEIIKSGDSDLIDKARRGVISVNRACRIVRGQR